jgi:hypothetical protein
MPDSRYSGWYSNRTHPEYKAEKFLIDNLGCVGDWNFMVVKVERMALILTDFKFCGSLTSD